MFRKYGLAGLALIAIAFLLNLSKSLPAYPFSLVIPHYFFTIGFWLFLDSVDFMINKSSILHKIRKRHMLLFYLFLTGILIGVILEFYGVFIAGVWASYFNAWPILKQIMHYPLGIIVGYGIPVLMYISLFRISLTLTKKEFGKFGKKIIPKNLENNFFRYLGIFGLIFLIIPLLLYQSSLSWNSVTRGLLFSFCLIGLWFILEHIEYRQHKESFLKDLFEGKWLPLIAVIITATIISIIWENLDFIRPSWTYKNLLFINLKFLGLPLLLIAGWMLLIIIYLSFFRIILNSKEKIW